MPNPCNNGQCIPQGSSFICQCPMGFTGKYCETCDPCNPNPCQAGQCISQGNTFFCQCPPGYSGQRFAKKMIFKKNMYYNVFFKMRKPKPMHSESMPKWSPMYISGKFFCMCLSSGLFRTKVNLIKAFKNAKVLNFGLNCKM